MSQAFIATYLVRGQLPEPKPDTVSEVAKAFLAARRNTGTAAFPFDGADDPSFFCARHLDGPVSWGVCRTDVRNQAQPNDWVVFFAGSRPVARAPDMEYHLVAVLQVHAKHSGRQPPAPFDGYLNRLVSAKDGGWIQDEPALGTKAWHRDWLWRLSAARWGHKAKLERMGADQSVSDAYWSNDGADGRNYIAFRQDAGFVLDRPVLVARKSGSALQEQWLEQPQVRTLRDAIFGGDATRYLRTMNRQQPHRHTRRPLADAGGWYRAVSDATAALE